MTNQLNALMQREMTRREFLGILGFGVLSILGFHNIIQFLTSKTTGHRQIITGADGYGSTAYGGGRD